MTFKLGDTVCDMHYGLPTQTMYPEETPIECRHHTVIEMKSSGRVMDAVLEGVGLDQSYHNKMAVVVRHVVPSLGSWMTAVYSYDDRRFGSFQFRIK